MGFCCESCKDNKTQQSSYGIKDNHGQIVINNNASFASASVSSYNESPYTYSKDERKRCLLCGEPFGKNFFIDSSFLLDHKCSCCNDTIYNGKKHYLCKKCNNRFKLDCVNRRQKDFY